MFKTFITRVTFITPSNTLYIKEILKIIKKYRYPFIDNNLNIGDNPYIGKADL